MLSLKQIRAAVAGTDCAFRTRLKLQPADGPGGKVFPPTHLDGKYAVEQRIIPDQNEGKPVGCVLLDSVQSHANRCEEALELAVQREQITLPRVVVDFSGAELIDPVDEISSLSAPHRLADAILRDSELDGTAFRSTDVGRRLDFASMKNATPLFDLSPHSLLFGLWDSTGPKGGLGVKFQRSLVGEIVGCNIEVGKRTSSRIDPLGIVSAAHVVGDDQDWQPVDPDAKKMPKDAIKPSKINHGNIPPTITDGGITMSYAQYSATVSLPAIRRLRFPVDGVHDADRDIAGQTVIAALGLLSITLACESGFDLRSRCLLWPEEAMQFQRLGKPGEAPESIDVDSDSAIAFFNEAVDAAKAAGLPWREDPIVLTPSAKLVKLLNISQAKLAQSADIADEG